MMDYLESLTKIQHWLLAILALVVAYALAWWLEWPLSSSAPMVILIVGLLAIDIAKWAYAKFAKN
jgi:hypothetical protein